MFSTDHRAFEGLGLQISDLQDFFGLLDQRYVARIACLRRYSGEMLPSTIFLNRGRSTLSPFENANGRAFTFTDDAEQQVLHANVVMPQPQGFFSAVSDDVLHAG